MKNHWKVPLRAVYCDTFSSMLKQTFWCHVVIRVFPHARDLGSDPLLDMYVEKPESFYDQYRSAIRSARQEQQKLEFG